MRVFILLFLLCSKSVLFPSHQEPDEWEVASIESDVSAEEATANLSDLIGAGIVAEIEEEVGEQSYPVYRIVHKGDELRAIRALEHAGFQATTAEEVGAHITSLSGILTEMQNHPDAVKIQREAATARERLTRKRDELLGTRPIITGRRLFSEREEDDDDEPVRQVRIRYDDRPFGASDDEDEGHGSGGN